jgi:GAF domain-containing protein
MRFVAWSGLSDEYRAAVDGHSPWLPDETTATPLLISDVEGDASLAGYLPALRREGIRALAFVPLQFGSKLLGKFMLYYDDVHAFLDAEIALAHDCGPGRAGARASQDFRGAGGPAGGGAAEPAKG